MLQSSENSNNTSWATDQTPEVWKILSYEELDTSPSNYIHGEIDNPFARICCRTRRLSPTECDGTCPDCKRERVIFEGRSITNITTRQKIGEAIEEDSSIPSNGTESPYPKDIFQRKINHLNSLKEAYFDRMRSLDSKYRDSPTPPGTTLH